MWTDLTNPLKRAIGQKLRTIPGAADLMGKDDTLGPRVAEQAEPALWVTVPESRRWHSATFEGQEHDVQVHIQAREAGTVDRLREEVVAALHDCDLPLPGHALIEMSFQSAGTRDPNGQKAYAWITFFALTLCD